MILLRKILFPISFLYGQIIRFRNKSYDKGIRTSTVFAMPIIGVGNLNTGGTGKTPHIEYLVNLLKDQFKVAVLSRGYKRKSKGFVLANKNASANLIGDEPMQYHLKFKSVYVAVDNDRAHGINTLKKLKIKPELVLLDDAYQHRKVKLKINILLTTYNDLYVDDCMLPTGNLRELPCNAKRASHIIVSKCPKDLSAEAQQKIRLKLKPKPHQKLYFSTIAYKNEVLNNVSHITLKELQNYKVLLVTGIASPKPLQSFLTENNIDHTLLKYSDHYNFTKKDKEKIDRKLQGLNTKKALIITTEKDYVRSFIGDKKVFYLPIEVVFLQDAQDFNEEMINYVQQSSRNS
ncbi:MAG: tetraacyldisaccharide 4'-kinase [Flavobacteriaceae bacterium]|nr:tetraacyldisaccharide 4'-kinase [Flavobacteriaceae bacterium]